MEKLVYVLWRSPNASPADFRQAMLDDACPRIEELGVHGLTVNLADEAVGKAVSARLTRLDPPLDGTLNFWLDSADDRGPYEEAIAQVTSRSAGYLVVESVPIVNRTQRSKPGERTPGINMIACLERPKRIAWDAWVEHWHGPHRQVALETQCTFHYVRNVVVRALTKGAPAWSGIVEEGFPSDAVTDPMLWYKSDGSPEVMKQNLKRMVDSCQVFLDLDRVESHPLSEYRIVG
jgi:hypothetical protein